MGKKRKFRIVGEVIFPRCRVDEETFAFSAMQARHFVRLRLAERYRLTKVVFGELDIIEVGGDSEPAPRPARLF